MLFTSIEFWGFAICFIASYFTLHGKARLWLCLSGSYLFYGYWDWRFLGLIFALTSVNFVIGKLLDGNNDRSFRKVCLCVSISSSLGVLGFFKYCGFFLESISDLFERLGVDAELGTLNVILPVGISFYTFQAMSYTIDVYRSNIDGERSFLRFATYISFFPQLVAGPIVRASEFLPQLREDLAFSWANLLEGAVLVTWGFVLKSLVADSIALFVDPRFGNPQAFGSLDWSLTVLFYAFQIYGDFAGYSLIAIGIAKILGFDFPTNFKLPYLSTSFSDFWSRWHISLSTWLRDYLYIPLGGNRCGKARTYVNLILTMVLGGLWHGASWNFVIWGLIHGTLLCLQRLLGFSKTRPGDGIFSVLRCLLVFFCVCAAWIFFRASSLDDALWIFSKILSFEQLSFADVKQRFIAVKCLLLVLSLVVLELFRARFDCWSLAKSHPALYFVFFLLSGWALLLGGTFGNDAFIYFQF